MRTTPWVFLCRPRSKTGRGQATDSKALEFAPEDPSSPTVWPGSSSDWETRPRQRAFALRFCEKPDSEIAAHLGEVLWAKETRAKQSHLARRFATQPKQFNTEGHAQAPRSVALTPAHATEHGKRSSAQQRRTLSQQARPVCWGWVYSAAPLRAWSRSPSGPIGLGALHRR